MSLTKKKVRPATASGILESSKVSHILDDFRPSTADAKAGVKVKLGFEPTYLTSFSHSGDNFKAWGTTKGKQVHGGINLKDLKEQGRRATLGPTQNLQISLNNLPRPHTAPAANGLSVKIEEKITLEHLNKMKQAFEEADEDSSGTLDMEEFKNVFKYFLKLKGVSEQQMTELFMKIDSSSDGEINWDGFCTYMQLEYAEKEESYFRAKETAFHLPATIESSAHRDTVLRITHTSDNTFLTVGQDGMVCFWSDSLQFKRTKQIESGTKKSKWITDFILMPQFNKFIISTGDREVQFHELSTFEAYCQISSLETVPLKLDYCYTGPDECILMYGDSEGCISIFIMKSVGELLRLWKKMPKMEGIASVNMDSVIASEHIRFVRWRVHNDWVQELRYYHSIRCVISCSSDSNNSLVIGQTIGSTHIEASLKDTKKGGIVAPVKDGNIAKRRLPADETVFKIYKGVKTFDFCKIKNIMATGGMDRLVRLWNPYVPTKPVGILRGHVTPIFYLFIVADDNRLFSISNDKTVKVWDIHDQACLLTVRPKSHLIKGDLSAVHFNSISRGLALATDHIALLTLKNKPLSMVMTTSHKEPVSCCKFNASFNHLVTSSEASVIKVWDMENGSEVFEYSKAHDDDAVSCMAFDLSQRRLITGGQDGKLKVWNYNNGHCISVLEPDEELDEVTALVYFQLHKNKYIVSVGWDRRINIYSDDQNDYHHRQTPFIRWPDDQAGRGHKEDILAVTFCPPTFLATASYDGEVILWNVTSGRIFCKLHSNICKDADKNEMMEGQLSVSQIVYLGERSNERQAASIVTNGPRGLIHFWNIFDSSTEYATFKASTNQSVPSMCATSNDDILFTGDDKGFITSWDVVNYCRHGKQSRPPDVIHHWRAHIQPISCMELVEEHKCIITSSNDCTVRLWTLEGHFVGSFGQPNKWNIYDKSTYQHPMAPYDVLVDPDSLPKHPVLEKPDKDDDDHLQQSDSDDALNLPIRTQRSKHQIGADDLASLLKTDPSKVGMGKRLRHARLQRNTLGNPGGSAAYKTLKCYELEEVPPEPKQNNVHKRESLDF